MTRFILAIISIWLCFVSWLLYEEGAWSAFPFNYIYFDGDLELLGWLLPLLILTPAVTTWAVIELLSLAGRIDDRRVNAATTARFWRLGWTTGLLGVLLLGLALTFLPWQLQAPDLVLVITASTLAAAIPWWLAFRSRPGACITCAYDTRHVPYPHPPAPRRCPECGTGIL